MVHSVPLERNHMVHLSYALKQSFSEVELYLAPGVKSNDLGKIKCYVFDLGTMKEGVRNTVHAFGRYPCRRLE